MRYAIFGDIHANWEALGSVLIDAHEQGCTRHACTGDLVGYNADPGACVDLVRSMGCPVVRGNHDEESASDSELVGLNPIAKGALLWTRRQLNPEQKDWLRSLPLVQQVADFTLVHATLESPGLWSYVVNKFDAMASMAHQTTQLCFYGHTHSPRIYEGDAPVPFQPDSEFPLQPELKYMINVGSVGQPRDGDWRACYAIYDDERQAVTVRRVEYDLKTAQQKTEKAGLW